MTKGGADRPTRDIYTSGRTPARSGPGFRDHKPTIFAAVTVMFTVVSTAFVRRQYLCGIFYDIDLTKY